MRKIFSLLKYVSEVSKLANIKSAKKRILVNRTKAERNKSIRSAVKTSIKKVDAAVANQDKAAAEAALKDAISTISKATSKGVYHKNNCARKVSRLTKAVNSIA
ncbi:MAG: 30S ribosomal protein S20 [Blautia sp.]